ncbi:MAG: nitroreductase family protein [Marinobacter sp.]|uniref:nitroreductase family protein n=1 Tax=Marinobacter sp. TaxID=50741 RepID=UPI0034A001D7
MTDNNRPFSEQEPHGLDRTIYERRDVRSKFLPDPIPDDVLARLLNAAHHAPSVGFMQPWDFLVIDSIEVGESVPAIFEQENRKAAENYPDDKGALDFVGPINPCPKSERFSVLPKPEQS